MPAFQLLHSLPAELLSDILTYLPTSDLSSLNLASKWTYNHATPLLWREVTLVDCSTSRSDGRTDDHDDTPLLRKLLILATNPWIAGHVQVLNHRCHLPPVGIFNELPKTPFSGSTMSLDPRTQELVRRAVVGMERVHTLRIIFGHPNLNDALLRYFFSTERFKQMPIRRLWLEDCRISGGCDMYFPSHPTGLPSELGFTGLESVRFRRMPLRPASSTEEVLPRFDIAHARGAERTELQDGCGGLYATGYHDPWLEIGTAFFQDVEAGSERLHMMTERLRGVFELPMQWDDEVFEKLGREVGLPRGLPDVRNWDSQTRAMEAWRGPLLDPADWKNLPDYLQRQQRERLPSSRVATNLIKNASTTLTNLCFDWVLALPLNLAISMSWKPEKYIDWLSTHADLFALRFPNLRAFQYRNAVTVDTIIPPGLFLLDHATPMRANNVILPNDLLKRLDLACLEFMEAHPNLQCLAWPMEAFLSAKPIKPDIASRVQAVIDNLGRTLVDLRVDTMYSPSGERQTDDADFYSLERREQRRRFISDFASKMSKVESIKVEGGMPRDERREVLRALHRCPINKIVLIGVCSPIGNTWGAGGADLTLSGGQMLDVDDISTLESEYKEVIHRLGHSTTEAPSSTFKFEANYGWPPSPPLLHTIASYHASTVTELKFCGYKGAPVLFDPTPITSPMLAPLRHFHNLRTLIISFCLLTIFEGAPRDHEIIRYWLDARSPTTTSLVRVISPGADGDEEMGGWERELNTKFAPSALTAQVVRQVGPVLSERAKARKGGTHVRVSMCLGEWGGIFDLDVQIGKDEFEKDVCLRFEGPREELEAGRRRGKLEERRWF